MDEMTNQNSNDEPVVKVGWIGAVDLVDELAIEDLLVKRREIGAQKVVTKTKQTLVVHLQNEHKQQSLTAINQLSVP